MVTVSQQIQPTVPAKDPFDVHLASEELGLLSVDGFGFINAVNEALLAIVGFEANDLLDKPLRLLFPELDDTAVGDQLQHLLAELRGKRGGYLEAVTADGAPVQLDVWIFDGLTDKTQQVLCCRNITREVGLQDALQHQREQLSAIYSQVADGIIILDRQGFVEHINPVALQLLELGHRTHDNVHVDEILTLKNSDNRLYRPFSEALERQRTLGTVDGVHLELANGVSVPVVVAVTLVRDRNNSIAGCVLVIRAVSESRRVSSRLSWNETHDPLTQLANRRQVENELIFAIDNAHLDDSTHGLLYIDLYNFSMINDTCGLAAGDEFLRQLSHMLAQAMDNGDVVGRTGNDEFAVLLWHKTPDEVYSVAGRVLDLVSDFSLPWGERRLKVGASIGVEMIDQASTSEVDIMLAARASCGVAKDTGRNRIHFPRKGKSLSARTPIAAVAASIGEALDEDRFVVYLQPIVALQSPGGAKHYEALVRMVDRDGNIVAPNEFIPAAEAFGLIDDIDKWVFEKVLSILDGLPESRRGDYSISVNLSGFTICDERFLDHVVNRLRELALEPGVLQFEITETAAVKYLDRAVHFIRALNELGCTFALDDFGSGVSSFAYLKELPVNYLKIDGSFVRKMEVGDVDYSMVSTINHLAHVMGLLTIAECVENQTQMTILREMGVDYGQGAYFSMPQPLEKVLEL